MTRTRSRRLPAALLAVVLLIAICTGTASAIAWQTETVDSAGRVGFFTSLALDGAGNPRISYFDETNRDLRYAWRDGSGWHAETVDAVGDVGRWASLALDGAGNPRISYFDETNDDLKYAWRDSAGWHAETVDASGSVGGYTSLALDRAGSPRISYYDYTGADLKYAWRDGAGWRTEIVDSYHVVGWYTSLALDRAGNPRISYLYEGTDDLRYAWRDGSGWHIEVVDTEGYVGKCSSLVLDSAGNPRISYFDDANDTRDDLKYAWRDSSGWHIEIVDAEGWVGWYTSLALDGAGNPRISYFDDTNDDLKYAWRDGSGWHAETVDSAGNVGMWTSLALDGAGNPWISYLDYSNGDLKVARPGVPPTPTPTPTPPPYGEVIPGGTAPPTDTDGDGLYEDVNGNGRRDFSDILIYFNQMEWIATNGPVDRFDFNGNGLVDFADVVSLFNALGTPAATPITAGFTMDRANGTAPLEVNFTSTSTGPFDSLAWTVMSGQAAFATMNGTAPAFTFRAPGAYTVALTARNASTNASATVAQPVTVTAPSGPNLPYPGPHVLPGRIEAEDYDVSVSSPAYADTTAANEGGAYRLDAVDIEVGGSNYNIAWIRTGEFLNYTVEVAAAGTYTLTACVASPYSGASAALSVDGAPAATYAVPNTGSYGVFRTVSVPVSLPAGTHTLRLTFSGVGQNLDWFDLTPTATGSPTPYKPLFIPGTIQAEDYNRGGEWVAYHDTTPGNRGGAYRQDDVDIETTGGITNVGWVLDGEFLTYNATVVAAGNYTMTASMASPNSGRTVALSVDGSPVATVPVPNTGSFSTYRTVGTPVFLEAGAHILRLTFGGDGQNLDWIAFATADATPTPTPNATVNVTPTVTVTVTPNTTANATPTVTVTPTETAIVTPSPTPTVTAIPGQEYTLTVASLDLINERVSIRNSGVAGVNLQGCTLSNQGSTRVYTFPAFVLGPGATVRVHTWSGANTGTDLYWGLGWEAWNDYSDTATLRTPDGTLISSMSRWTWA